MTLPLLSLLLACALGPTPPPDALDGDVVEVDGVPYQMKDGVLYTLDDPALDDARYSVTVTGSHLDENKRKKVVRAESISSEEIAASGARTLADVLETQAGIQIGSSLGLGQQVQLDGMDGRHVLVLIDGKPVTGRVNNRVDVGRIPVSSSSVERIEIVRGPMSALYGSEALGGVINIITKKPKLAPGGELSLFSDVVAGALWKGAGLHLYGGREPVAGRIDVDVADLPGVDRGGVVNGRSTLRPDGRDDVPARRQASFHAETVVPLFDNAELHGSADLSQQTSAARLAPAVPFLDRARNAELSVSGGVEADVGDDSTASLDLSVSRFRHVFEKVPRGDVTTEPLPFCGAAAVPLLDGPCASEAAVRTDAVGDQARLEGRFSTELWSKLPVTLPLDPGSLALSAGAVLLAEQARRENGAGEDTLPGGGLRDSVGLYGELLWRPTAWLAVLPGARLDAFTPSTPDGGNWALGPKLAVRADLPLSFYARASYGRGFRLPSFEERFLRFDHSELGYVVQGNPELKPEVNNGVRAELGFEPLSSLSLSVEGYLNLVDQLITESVAGRDAQGVPLFSYENAARSYTSGINTSVRLGPWFGTTLDVSYQVLLNAVDASACPADNPYFCTIDDGAVSLPLRPAHSVSSTLRTVLAPTDTTLFVRGTFTSARGIDVQTEAPAFLLLSAGVKQPVLSFLDLSFSVENLLDSYDALYGPKPGRRVSLQLVLRP